jgi:hypothetical protein
MDTMNDPQARRGAKWWQVVVIIPFLPFLLVLVVIALTCFAVASVCLHATIWTWWCLRGRDILFVYSDSPMWHDYIEERILPQLGERAIVLNWSQRKRWRISIARLAFHHFAGYRQFNPLAVVFRPFRKSLTFRFWQPFKDFKHGHPEALRQMESEFLESIGIQESKPTA